MLNAHERNKTTQVTATFKVISKKPLDFPCSANQQNKTKNKKSEEKDLRYMISALMHLRYICIHFYLKFENSFK